MPRRFRVTYVGHVARYSGGEIGVLRFIEAAEDVDATVVLAEDGPLVERLRHAGAHVEILPLDERVRGMTRAEIRPGRAQAVAAVELTRYVGRLQHRLRELQPDLVHAFSLKAGVYGSLAARLARVPMIWHLQDRLAPDYLPPSLVRPMRLLASTLPNALLAPSRHTLATVGHRFRPGLRTAVLSFPVPIPAEPHEIRDRVEQVGIVGRLAPWKGQHVFLEAFALAFPDGAVRGRIIGSPIFGEIDYEQDLRAQAQRLGIADRVDFVGFTSDVRAELARLDVLVHASVSADPLATVVLEGLAAGIPLVAADDGGHIEHIENGRHALLSTPGDARALAAALRRLSQDRELRVRIAQAGRERAQRFAAQAVVGDMLRFYADVAGSRANER